MSRGYDLYYFSLPFARSPGTSVAKRRCTLRTGVHVRGVGVSLKLALRLAGHNVERARCCVPHAHVRAVRDWVLACSLHT